MYFVIGLAILLFEAGSFAGAAEYSVAQAFMNNEIVRKIIVKPPTQLISVNYSGTSISPGMTVQPFKTLKKPDVSYKAKDNELYTILFFGPDLPPSIVEPLTQLIHWGLYDIPGQDISKAVEFATYLPPTPYPDGFPYFFLLFKQNGSLKTSQVPNLSFLLSRTNFSYIEFAKKYNLGDPLAGNFMFESYVQIVPDVAKSVYNIVQKPGQGLTGALNTLL